jgi:hypothetical protein
MKVDHFVITTLIVLQVCLLAPLTSAQQQCSISAGNTYPGNCEKYPQSTSICNAAFGVGSVGTPTVCFPNNQSDTQVLGTIGASLNQLGKNQTNVCLALITNFLCSMYLPQCSAQGSVLPMCMSVCNDVFVKCYGYKSSDARTTCIQYGIPISDGTPNITCTYVSSATATTSGSATSATSLTSSTTGSKHYNNSISGTPSKNNNNILVISLVLFFVGILL